MPQVVNLERFKIFIDSFPGREMGRMVHQHRIHILPAIFASGVWELYDGSKKIKQSAEKRDASLFLLGLFKIISTQIPLAPIVTVFEALKKSS